MSQDAPESTTVSFVPHDPVSDAREKAGLLPIPLEDHLTAILDKAGIPPHASHVARVRELARQLWNYRKTADLRAENYQRIRTALGIDIGADIFKHIAWRNAETASAHTALDAEKIPAHDSINERVQELARQRRNLSRTLDVYLEQTAALKVALGVEDFADLRGAVEKLKADLAETRREFEIRDFAVAIALDTVGAPKGPPSSDLGFVAGTVRRIGLAFSQAQVDRCALEDVHDALRRSEFGGAASGVPGRVKDVLESLRARGEYVNDLRRAIEAVRESLAKASVTTDLDDALLGDAVNRLAAWRDAARAEVEQLRADDIIKVFGGPSTSPLVDESFQFASDKVSLPSRVTAKSKVKKATKTKSRAESKADVALRARAEAAAEKKASRRG